MCKTRCFWIAVTLCLLAASGCTSSIHYRYTAPDGVMTQVDVEAPAFSRSLDSAEFVRDGSDVLFTVGKYQTQGMDTIMMQMMQMMQAMIAMQKGGVQ